MSTLELASNRILILYKEAERISNLPSLDQMLRTVEIGKMWKSKKVVKTSTFWGKTHGVSCGVYAP